MFSSLADDIRHEIQKLKERIAQLETLEGGGVTDHGELRGLADDDHTQYLNEARHTAVLHNGLGIDHGSLSGLGDNDHPQYQLRLGQGAMVYRSVDQSIPNNAWTSVQFNGELSDSDNICDLTQNNTRLTIKTPGMYIITAGAALAANGTGVRGIAIVDQGGGHMGTVLMRAVSDAPTILSTSSLAWLNAGNYLTLQVYQNSGASLNVTPYFIWTNMRITRVG